MLSADEYRAIFEAAPDGCLVVADDGVIRGANPKAGSMFGYTPAELVGRTVDLLVPEALRGAHSSHRTKFSLSPHGRPMGVGLDLRGQRSDGSSFPVEVSLSPWPHPDGTTQVICAIRDVSAYRRLQNFSEGALRASEEERKRIARELHDDTAQRLVTLILRVRALSQEDETMARYTLFEAVREEIVEAADAVKRMSRGLRPPEIEELGLTLAVQAHLRSLAEGGHMRVETRFGSVESYLDVTAKLALYRVVQEALSNVVRHSGADRATVRIERDGDEVVVEVVDEGAGFVPRGAVDRGGGLGLIGMQERTSMIGGRLSIDSAPGRGTRVRVAVPLRGREEPNA